MAENNLITQLQGKEQEIAALTFKLAQFFEREKIAPPLALGCLAETVSRLTTFFIKDMEDIKAAHSLAEQMAGIFIHAITHSLKAHMAEKTDQDLSVALKTPEDIGFLSSDLGHA